MIALSRYRFIKAAPIVVSTGLVLAACGGGGDSQAVQAPIPAVEGEAPAAAPETAPSGADVAGATADVPSAPDATKKKAAGASEPRTSTAVAKAAKSAVKAKTAAGSGAGTPAKVSSQDSAAEKANRDIYEQKNGATEIGVTRDSIKVGSVSMHGMALGNVLVAPVVRANLATAAAINDRGGVLGRRIIIADCDDGPGEVSRAKACIKKLVGQDKIFSLITAIDWATASIHDDLKQHKLPYIGAWAYSQTEWQDPYMFPTHMSMIHEAMAGANWAKNVIKPKTYGLLCLTSPEMQLACNEVKKIMDASGSKMVKKIDVPISETSMSSQVLAMRAANPEHLIHYVINPATMAKFMVEAAQQNYYPPRGISGNHLAAEVLGSLFGKHPAGRYWTNTTYRMWGTEYMAMINKYARGNRGLNHHITQAGYVALNVFAQAAKEIGPNLTRERMMATLGNGTVWKSDASLDQKFSYVASERTGTNWSDKNGQGREFMYKYTSANTVANPEGGVEGSGWEPDPDQFVIYTK